MDTLASSENPDEMLLYCCILSFAKVKSNLEISTCDPLKFHTYYINIHAKIHQNGLLDRALHQGSQELRKFWKNTKKSSMHGKIMEFEKTLNNRGKILDF